MLSRTTFPLVLFLMLNKVVLTEFVDEICKTDQSNAIIKHFFSVVRFVMLCEVVLTFQSMDEILK